MSNENKFVKTDLKQIWNTENVSVSSYKWAYFDREWVEVIKDYVELKKSKIVYDEELKRKIVKEVFIVLTKEEFISLLQVLNTSK